LAYRYIHWMTNFNNLSLPLLMVTLYLEILTEESYRSEDSIVLETVDLAKDWFDHYD
jgi:hypothetical protein